MEKPNLLNKTMIVSSKVVTVYAMFKQGKIFSVGDQPFDQFENETRVHS